MLFCFFPCWSYRMMMCRMASVAMQSLLLVGCLLMSSVYGDLYLHNMRGSNNRLAETTATRNNNNRLFDSQVYFHHNHYHHYHSIQWQKQAAQFVVVSSKWLFVLSYYYCVLFAIPCPHCTTHICICLTVF